MTIAVSDDQVAHYGSIESLVILAACVAVFAYGLWAMTRDPRVQRNTRRDEVIIGLGLAAISLGIAVLAANAVSWNLGDPVEFGRLGNAAVPAFIPFAIAGIGGLAALIGTLVAPLVRRGRPPVYPVIRPSRRRQPGR